MKTKRLLGLDHRRWHLRFAAACLVCLGLAGCERQSSTSDASGTAGSQEVRGNPIGASSTSNTVRTITNAPFVPADFSRPDRLEGGMIQLGWDKVSGFKFDVYEVSSETNIGRALIKSDDVIPMPVKAYDGK